MQKFILPKNLNENFKKALKAFLSGKTLIAGNYVATANALVYRIATQFDGFGQDVLMIRLSKDGKPYYLGNSSSMEYVDTRIAFGNRTRKWGQNSVQKAFEKMGVPMLPFTAFTQSGLKITETEIVSQAKAETVKREIKRDRKGKQTFANIHFTGATLFKNKNEFFLFDIDREEIKHGIFNPFIVHLPKKSSSISEAYDSLIPNEVRKAMRMGSEIKRQGEHFFIKLYKPKELTADLASPLFDDADFADNEKRMFKEARLSTQGNRDHIASRFNEKSGLVSGIVRHEGREHADLDLTSGWWKPVPNTAVKAFTISGDID